MDLNTAIHYALNGEALLFVGAGFSLGGTNLLGRNFPSSKELTNLLLKKLNIEENDNYDLDDVASFFLENRSEGEKELIELFENLFTCKSYNDYYRILLSIPWKKIYTTNYDNLIQKVSDELGIRRKVITLDEDPSKVNKSDCIFHLNGYVKKLQKESFYKDIKLTKQSYAISNLLQNSNWIRTIRSDFDNVKAIIFIGFSMAYDLDISRILYNSNNYKNRTIFIERKSETIDPIIDSKKKIFGQTYYIGVEGFANSVSDIQKNFIPTKVDYTNLESFIKIKSYEGAAKYPKPRDIYDLLIYGNLEESLVKSNYNNSNYLVYRKNYIKKALEKLDKPDCKVLLIHSEIGNGKTCLIHSLKEILRVQHDNVFIFNPNKKDLMTTDLESLEKINGIVFIIIENYNLHLDLLSEISRHNINYKLILTVRTYVNENVFVKIEENLKVNSIRNINTIQELNLNHYNNDDFSNFEKLSSKAGLRKSKSSNSSKSNKKYRVRSLSEFLLDISSIEIRNKLNESFRVIKENETLKEIFIVSLINSLLNLELKYTDIQYLCGLPAISPSIKLNPDIRTFIDFQNETVSANSSIFARNIIAFNDLELDVLDVLIKIIKNFDNINKPNLIDSLISASNIWVLVGRVKSYKFANHPLKKQVIDKILEYYDNLSNMSFYNKDLKNNAFFWLQYAIVCLDTEEYDRAETYFNNAYDISKEHDLNTFQIDSHYARFLLCKYSSIKNVESIFNNHDIGNSALHIFLNAHNIIKDISYKKVIPDYRYKQAVYYYDYLQVYFKYFSTDQIEIYKNKCLEIMILIKEYIKKANDLKISYRRSDLNNTIKSLEKSLAFLQQEHDTLLEVASEADY